MEELIIWGAGKAAEIRYDWVILAGYQVKFFVDNDSKKWGGMIRGVTIYSPEIIKGCKGTIVIPDLYKDEIEAQLDEIPYQGRKVGFEQFRKEAFFSKKTSINLSNARIGNKTTFIFDSYFTGLNWGGVESWSCMVANQLADLGAETQLICGESKKFDECTRNCIHFTGYNEINTVKEMAVKIAAFLPCVFITHGSVALYAAQIVKAFFPDYIKVIAVAHGDEHNTYERLKFWSDGLDRIVCISRKIYMEFQDKYGLKEELLLYRPNPIKTPSLEERRIKGDGTLRIGFAARLRKEQKRVHLLPEIIEASMRKRDNVEFDIAGEGECLELLRNYVSEHHMEDKVHVLGWIPSTGMGDFWKNEDIYLNISDFEGMSLAMLEAMACGAVPVVTDVSGVSDLIEDGKNGFIVPVNGWLDSVGKIEILDKDRKMLQRASDYNKKLIREKCGLPDYARWMMDMFHF